MKKIYILTVAFLFVFGSINCVAGNVLRDPGPVSIPSGMAKGAIAKAIEEGMLARGWHPNRKSDTEIIATLSTRAGKHIVKVLIVFDDKTINFSYLDSVNMGYRVSKPATLAPWDSVDDNDVGKQLIHPKYNSWVLNLANDIKEQLSRANILQRM